MKVAIVGAGAVGCYFGGRLALAGHDVSFLARGKTLEVLGSAGLRAHSISGNFELPEVKATAKPAEVGPADLIVVAVKAWHVPDIAPQLVPLIGPSSLVLPLQNGVEAPAQLAEHLGAEAVLGGYCKLIVFREQPGVIRHAGVDPAMVSAGEMAGGHSERVENLLAAFTAAGSEAIHDHDIRAGLWRKLLFIASWGGVAAVARAPLGPLWATPETRAMLEGAMHEVVATGRAHGVNLSEADVEAKMAFLDGLPVTGTASMQRDIAAGLPTELEACNGAVVRLAREKSIETPINACIYAALKPQELRARKHVEFERL